jgi:antitoxin component HigA of HigAB toxin-antitoxin module
MGLRLGVTSGQDATEAQVDAELSQLVTQLTNEINWHMRQRGLTRADLASRMGVSPGRVSQVLSGGENLTLRTLASLATALDGRFELALRPRGPVTANGHGEVRPAATTVTVPEPQPQTPTFPQPSAFSAFSPRR